MKKISLILFAVIAMVAGGNAFAQGKYGADSAECIKYLSYYQEYYKQKNYDDALRNWRKAYKLCPGSASQNMFIHGTTLMTRVYSQTRDQVARAAIADTILTLQDERMAFYPKSRKSVLNNKGNYIIKYKENDTRYVYDQLQEIISELGGESRPSLLVIDLQSAVKLYQDGATDSKVASCENIITIFGPRFEAEPDNVALVNTIVRLMNTAEDCLSNDLYLNAVTSMHKNDPSYNSAYFLYKLHSNRGNVDQAVTYLEEAIAAEASGPEVDAEYLYELANYALKNKMKGKAYDAARKAADLDYGFAGKAYFLMGTIWGSTACGGNEIQRRAPYWVAVDYLQKAKAADASLTEDANRLIGSYSAYYPQAAEAFMYDISAGQAYTVSCGGLTATTTVRVSR